jgi:hypothetical protein
MQEAPVKLIPLLLAGTAMTFAAGARAATDAGPAITVTPSAGQHPISPYIYGMAEYGVAPAFQQAAQLGVLRWGGDGTTRYNWQVDSSNAGFDWFFMGGDGNATPTPSGGPDALVLADQATASATLLTIPIIPYINRSAAWSCSFPVQVYGAQQATNPYVFPNGDTCGNSLALKNGAQLHDKHILANHIANHPSIQEGWVQHLVERFGKASKGGVQFYQLDNEPLGWANTHRDVQPKTPAYSTIVELGRKYAAVIKKQDPTALVLGPSDFTLGGWIGTPSLQNNLFAGQYYLQQMAAYAAAHEGHRLIDYFDEHYYFNFTDPTSQLASTRTLWDPTYNGGTWVEQYEFDGPMQLIPRFNQWIAQYYPGTMLSFSEYSIDSGNKVITDALAEADVLGIFGAYEVGLAAMWNPPQPTDPIAFSFLFYRNVDGAGHGFGATSVQTQSASPPAVSAYGALRDAGTLTLVLINKTTSTLSTPVKIQGQTDTVSAALYRYSGADLTAIQQMPAVTITAGAATLKLPGYSMSMLVVPVQ